MTACVNNKKYGRRVAGVVTASLVGALTLGGVSLAAVPTVALAEDAAPQAFGAGGENGSEFASGRIDLTFKVNGSAVPQGADASTGYVTVQASEDPIQVEVGAVHVAGTGAGDTSETVNKLSDYKVRVYAADEKGEPTGAPLASRSVYGTGNYVVTVTSLDPSAYYGQTFKQVFSVVGKDLPTGLTATDGTDAADNYFTFSGKGQDVRFKYTENGETKYLEPGTDYTVKYTDVTSGKTVDAPTDAHEYVATLTGAGLYSGKSTVNVGFTVNPFIVDPATKVVVPTGTSLPLNPQRVYRAGNGLRAVGDLDPSLVVLSPSKTLDSSYEGVVGSNPDGSDAIKVTYNQDEIAKGNIVVKSSADLTTTFNKAYSTSDTFYYNGQALGDTYDVFQSDGTTFDPSAVKAYANGRLQNVTVTVVSDGNGVIGDNDGGNDDEAAGKDYKVTFDYFAQIELKDGKKHWVGGTKTVTVHVWEGKVDASQLWAYNDKDGDGYIGSDEKKAITELPRNYDGTRLTTKDFIVTNADGSASSRNGKIRLTLKDSEGKAVDSVTDAGSYTLAATSDSWKITGDATLPITVSKVDLTTFTSTKLQRWNDVDGQYTLPMPTNFWAKFFGYDAKHVAFDDVAVTELGLVGKDDVKVPASVAVDVEKKAEDGSWRATSEVKAGGTYRVKVTVPDSIKGNFVLPEGDVAFEFVASDADAVKFSDVQPQDWFYKSVTDAYNNGYLVGYPNGTFAPNGTLSRAQAAAVLYNMSGQKFNETNGKYDEAQGWKTGFSDVDGHQWYAEPIAWAEATGVVNGYGNGKFGPDDPVTREQFAGMVANYAKVVNQATDTQGDPAELDKFSDKGSVSDWAVSSLAWATKRGVISGYDGAVHPGDTITRAQAAAIAVNYQPNKK